MTLGRVTRVIGARLLIHVVAYAIVVLVREAPEVATDSVRTLRLWKVGAVLVTGERRLELYVSAT